MSSENYTHEWPQLSVDYTNIFSAASSPIATGAQMHGFLERAYGVYGGAESEAKEPAVLTDEHIRRMLCDEGRIACPQGGCCGCPLLHCERVTALIEAADSGREF